MFHSERIEKSQSCTFSPENDDFTKKQTQFKPNKAKNKANLSQYKPNIEVQRKSRLFGNQLSIIDNQLKDHPKGCQFNLPQIWSIEILRFLLYLDDEERNKFYFTRSKEAL